MSVKRSFDTHLIPGLSLIHICATLGSVSLTGGNGGEALAAVDVASLTDVYDFSNDDEVEAYTASMNMDAITENLTNAGKMCIRDSFYPTAISPVSI